MNIDEYLKIEKISQEYIYDEKSQKCFEKSSGKEVTDEIKIMEIKSGLFVVNYVEYNKVREQMLEKLIRLKSEGKMQELRKTLIDYETIQPDNLLYLKKQKGVSLTLGQESIVKEMKTKRLESFNQKIEEVVKNSSGNIIFTKNSLTPVRMPYDFFEKQSDLGEAYIRNMFFKKGYKLDNFKIETIKDLNCHMNISFDPVRTKKIDKKEIRNITNSVSIKDVINTEEEMKKIQRTKYIRKHLLSLYDKAENDIMFNDRRDLEEKDIGVILKAINSGGLSPNIASRLGIDEVRRENGIANYTTFSVKRLLHLLKAADNITLDYGKNYLGEFASVEPIHTIIGELVQNKKNLEFLEEMAKNDDGKERKTIAERDRDRANKYLKNQNNPIALLKNAKVTEEKCVIDSGIENLTYSNVPENIKDKLALVRVTSRQNGGIPEKPIIDGRNIKFNILNKEKELY